MEPAGDLCGRDDREVSVDRTRKSLSKERTFSENIDDVEWLLNILRKLRVQVKEAVEHKSDQEIKSRVVKLKLEDFSQTTAEKAGWEVHICRRRKWPHFFNSKTRESCWNLPESANVPELSSDAQSAGWTVYYSKEYKVPCFRNKQTGREQLDNPDDN